MQKLDHQSEVADFAEGRRLDRMRASGGAKPSNSAARPRPAGPSLGPVLVKGSGGAAAIAAQPSFGDVPLRDAETRTRQLTQVIPISTSMTAHPVDPREYRILGAMALLGPAVWLGHAALVWLRLL